MTDKPTCETCPFWASREQFAMTGGYCHRHAPNVIAQGTMNQGWPFTHEGEWCGEHPDFPAKMTGFLATMSEDQRNKAREYRGPETHGVQK